MTARSGSSSSMAVMTQPCSRGTVAWPGSCSAWAAPLATAGRTTSSHQVLVNRPWAMIPSAVRPAAPAISLLNAPSRIGASMRPSTGAPTAAST